MGNDNSTRKEEKEYEEATKKRIRKYYERIEDQKNLFQKQNALDEAGEALEEEKRAYEKKYKELLDKESRMQTVHLNQPSTHVATKHLTNVSEAHQRSCAIYPNLQKYDFSSTSSGRGGNPTPTFYSGITSLSSAPPQAPQNTVTNTFYSGITPLSSAPPQAAQNTVTNTFYSGITSLSSAPPQAPQNTLTNTSYSGITSLPSAPSQAPQNTVTNTNMDLEAHLARTNLKRFNQKRNCPNTKDGCGLSLYPRDLAAHKKECPFNEMPCPVNNSISCNWRGKLNQLKDHFEEYHPEHCVADVNKEMKLPNINVQSYIVYLVVLGTYNFLIHIRVDAQKNLIMMTVQLIGTKMSAEKWTYQFHVYNKMTPRRKYQYDAVCHTNIMSVMEIFDKYDCATLNATHVKSFANNSEITYKFYLKKKIDQKSGECSKFRN